MEELDTIIARKKGVSQQVRGWQRLVIITSVSTPHRALTCVQVKDGRQAISANERQLADISNHGQTLRRHMATLADKFQRLEHQVWGGDLCGGGLRHISHPHP